MHGLWLLKGHGAVLVASQHDLNPKPTGVGFSPVSPLGIRSVPPGLECGVKPFIPYTVVFVDGGKTLRSLKD